MNSKILTLLIILSLALLSGSGLWYFHYLPKMKNLSTSNLAYAIEVKLSDYRKATGGYPTGDGSEILHQLRGNNPSKERFIVSTDGFKIEANQFVDEWNNPFKIKLDATVPAAMVSSAGKDGEFGTKDDVDSSEVRKILIDRGETPVQP